MLTSFLRLRLTALAVLAIASIGSAQTPARPSTPPANPASETVVLEAFTISTTQDKGYKAANAIGATRTNTPIADTPQSISVFNDLFIENTLSFDLTALTYFDPTFVPAQPDRGSYISRGFTVNATCVDGLPQRNTFGPNYTANVDRVEILKGAATILYGQGAGGATINRVLKRARTLQNTSVTATVGENEFRRVHLDTTGPLAAKIAGRPLAYRFNAVWQEGETFKRQQPERPLRHARAAHVVVFLPRAILSRTHAVES